MVKALFLAVLGLSVLSAAAEECGVHHTDLVKPFAGRWVNDKGDYYDIAPGRETRGSGDKILKPRFALELDGDAPDTSVLDCRKLTAEERDKIGEDIGNLSRLISWSGKPDDFQLYKKSLSRPPYPMLAFTHYESSQWLILLDKTHALDVWFGEGHFSVRVFKRN